MKEQGHSSKEEAAKTYLGKDLKHLEIALLATVQTVEGQWMVDGSIYTELFTQYLRNIAAEHNDRYIDLS